MKKYPLFAAQVTLIALIVWVLAYMFFPVSWFDGIDRRLGATITTIQGSDTLKDSRAVINTNFSNLNTDKLETGNIDTCSELATIITGETGSCGSVVFSSSPTLATPSFSGLTSMVNASSSLLSVFSTAYFGGTATSTFNSSGALTLASALGVASGGTATSTWLTGGLVFYDGSTLSQGSSAGHFYLDKTNARLGISSSTPAYGLSIGSQKAIGVQEYAPATTTSMTIDARNGNQQLIQLGGEATTVAFSNFGIGTTIRLIVCNPGGTAGAITWSNVHYFGGTAPTQTTTANVCDMYVVGSTAATSTGATTPIIWLAQGGANLQ